MSTGVPYLGTPPLSPLIIEGSSSDDAQGLWAAHTSGLTMVYATLVMPTLGSTLLPLRLDRRSGPMVKHLDEILISEWDASIARAKAEAHSARPPDPNRHQHSSCYKFDELVEKFQMDGSATDHELLTRAPCLLCHSPSHALSRCQRYYYLGILGEAMWEADTHGPLLNLSDHPHRRGPSDLPWSSPLFFLMHLESRIANPSLKASSVPHLLLLEPRRAALKIEGGKNRPYASINDHEM